MSDTRPNPLGIDGFDFVEYAAPDAEVLHDLFRRMGFTAVATHRHRRITLYRQGDINFLINEEPDSFAAEFARAHGPCACGFAIRVADAEVARDHALANGAEAVAESANGLAVQTPIIHGIGGSILYLVDQYGESSVFDDQYAFFPGEEKHPAGFGLKFIDHLTHNVYQGNMDQWAGFYERIFNFREIRYFDIKGAKTGLVSRAMTAPDDMVRIPINEATDDKSQIAEYLDEYKGEGIQHIALFTDSIYDTVEALRGQNLAFLDVPDTYYEMVDERLPGHGENLPRMAENRLLIDGDPETKKRLLLQIFTQTCIGPIFFEIIQRKGNEGFGEGNFQALFESIERDQERRGVI
ncbi:MAG: 4-hydroxyphenylpyruvate dioxygenase [Chromatiales bacterium]|jgi:4-hydroxyphenylpyruvate dioxygenase|nr:4-hydroxyphenylpyruvate dioxygenase [Chromatiales bacterium]